jgi:hypothetical protein
MRTCSFLLFASCLSFALSASATPMFRALGDLPGGDFSSTANAVSADGFVVVGGSRSGRSAGDVPDSVDFLTV